MATTTTFRGFNLRMQVAKMEVGWVRSRSFLVSRKMQTSRLWWNTARRFMSNAARKNDHGGNSLNQQVLDKYMVPGQYLRYFKKTRQKKRSLEVCQMSSLTIQSLTWVSTHTSPHPQPHSTKSTNKAQGLCMKMIQLQRLRSSILHNVFIVVSTICIPMNRFLDG